MKPTFIWILHYADLQVKNFVIFNVHEFMIIII